MHPSVCVQFSVHGSDSTGHKKSPISITAEMRAEKYGPKYINDVTCRDPPGETSSVSLH